MKPGTDHALNTFAGRIMEKVVPEIGDEYWQTEALVIATLMMASAQDYDKAADIRAQENREMRDLFGKQASRVSDAPLAQRLRDAAAGQDESLRITALQQNNETLKTLLIDLHAYADQHDGALSAQLWQLLNRFAEGRAMEMG